MSESPGEIRTVESAEELRELLGEVIPTARNKDRAALHAMDRAWIATSPFCLVATADARGNCDISPKGDPRGFVHILDDRTLALPERPGNRRGDGFHNILENPHVGLIFFVPGRGTTLRIKGRARIVREAPFFDAMLHDGHRPKLAVLVDIDNIFFHCAKAFMRSGLWEPDSWSDEGLPSHAEITHALGRSGKSLEELREYYGPSYADKLYREA